MQNQMNNLLNMKKTIEEMTSDEKLDLVEYCAHQAYKLKDLIISANTDIAKQVLNNYLNHLKNIILEVKETLHVTN